MVLGNFDFNDGGVEDESRARFDCYRAYWKSFFPHWKVVFRQLIGLMESKLSERLDVGRSSNLYILTIVGRKSRCSGRHNRQRNVSKIFNKRLRWSSTFSARSMNFTIRFCSHQSECIEHVSCRCPGNNPQYTSVEHQFQLKRNFDKSDQKMIS